MIIKNNLYNLGFQVLPIIIAIVTLPLSIKNLGNEYFGIYTLIISVIYLANFFNFGINESFIKIINSINSNNFSSRFHLFISSLIIIISLSIIISIFIFYFSEKIAYMFYNDSQPLHILFKDLISSLAYIFPFVLLNILLRSVLESSSAFFYSALLRALFNSWILLIPILINKNTFYYDFIQYILIGVIIFNIIHFYLIYFLKIIIFSKINFYRIKKYLKIIINISIWYFFSSLSLMLLMFTDRYLIGIYITVATITYYSPIFDMLNRLNIIPNSISSVAFPLLSKYIKSSLSLFNYILFKSFIAILILTFIPSLVLFIWGNEIIEIWLSNDFTKYTSEFLPYLILAVLINSNNILLSKVILTISKHKLLAYTNFFLALIYIILLVNYIKIYGLKLLAFSFLLIMFMKYIYLSLIVIKDNRFILNIKIYLIFNLLLYSVILWKVS